MTELLTAAQMRAIERAAIESGEVTGLELMERAGQGVVEAVFEEWPELAQGSFRAAVLCGPGNNGGDGFVVARLLRDWGWEVEVFLYGDPDKLPPDARVNYERWLERGEVHPYPATQRPQPTLANDRTERLDPLNPHFCLHYDLVVDALFGIGLTRPLDLPFSVCMSFADMSTKPGLPVAVSIDVPSGLDVDTGLRVGGEEVFFADLVVTFHKLKIGHTISEGPSICGKVVVKGIGL